MTPPNVTTITTTITSTVLLTVRGSDGNLNVNSITGEVVSREYVEDDDSPYHQIIRVDLAEWRAALQAADVLGREACGDVDILHVGYWSEDGHYEPPAYDYRTECWLRGLEYQRIKEQ